MWDRIYSVEKVRILDDERFARHDRTVAEFLKLPREPAVGVRVLRSAVRLLRQQGRPIILFEPEPRPELP